jgi:hypothetical protein
VPDLRMAAKDTLYLIFRAQPDFPYELLRELLRTASPLRLPTLKRIVSFVIEVSVAIYINHCDEPDVIQRTSDLNYAMAVDTAHLNLFRGPLGPVLSALLQSISASFSSPILNAILLAEVQPPKRFFELPAQERARVRRLIPLVDPHADVAGLHEQLAPFLKSDILSFNLLAAFVLAIQACHDFAATEPVIRSLFDELDGNGRLWVLLSFSVLIKKTPEAWIGVLEHLTQRLLEENPDFFMGSASPLLKRFDIVLFPLGVAYAKRSGRADMPWFVHTIRDAIKRADDALADRCIRGLTFVGFHFPEAVFATLRAAIPKPGDPVRQAALADCLANMRILHFNAVDAFLNEIGADEEFQRRVAKRAEVQLVHDCINWLGLYNNAVHFSVSYPKMRRGFAIRALDILADAPTPKDFVKRYTASTFEMGRNAGYRFTAWTEPA